MKYISLFSGIGGFELAIHNVFPEAECIGFSEVDKFALKVYQHHFPSHPPLGDVTKLKEEDIKELIEREGGCDLLVGGFPCQNLSSLARQHKYCNSEGLDGSKSGLFWDMIRVIEWIQKYNPKDKTLHLVIENNASMKNEYKKQITEVLQGLYDVPIYCTLLNGADFGVQRRRRLYWTTFEVSAEGIKCTQTWDDVLLPIEEVSSFICSHLIPTYNKIYNHQLTNHPTQIIKSNDFYKQSKNTLIKGKSRWDLYSYSDTMYKSCTITCSNGLSNILLDRRFGNESEFIVRKLSITEKHILFNLPKGYTSLNISLKQQQKCIGNTVIVKVIEFILNQLE